MFCKQYATKTLKNHEVRTEDEYDQTCRSLSRQRFGKNGKNLSYSKGGNHQL